MYTKKIQRLKEIRLEIKKLVLETKKIISSINGILYARAFYSWLTHIDVAMDRKNNDLSYNKITMQDTIEKIEFMYKGVKDKELLDSIDKALDIKVEKHWAGKFNDLEVEKNEQF